MKDVYELKVLEWPDKEQIEKMNIPQLEGYVTTMIDRMKEYDIPLEFYQSIMVDFQEVRKDEQRLREFMKGFVDLFVAEGMWSNITKPITIVEIPVAEA